MAAVAVVKNAVAERCSACQRAAAWNVALACPAVHDAVARAAWPVSGTMATASSAASMAWSNAARASTRDAKASSGHDRSDRNTAAKDCILAACAAAASGVPSRRDSAMARRTSSG